VINTKLLDKCTQAIYIYVIFIVNDTYCLVDSMTILKNTLALMVGDFYFVDATLDGDEGFNV